MEGSFQIAPRTVISVPMKHELMYSGVGEVVTRHDGGKAGVK